MDPLSLLSLTGHLLKLLSCGRDMVILAKETHRSPAGAAKADQNAASIAKRSQALSQAVRLDTPSSLLTEDQQRLCDAASECEKVCSELEEELSNRFARDKIRELEERLARCEGQMSAQLLHIMQDTWADFLATSETSRSHITAVREGVDILRQGLQVSSLDEAVLRQLRKMLEISDENTLRRRQNQILRALRFDSMYDRFAGVSDAHERTFDRRLQLEARDKFVRWLEAGPTTTQDAVFHVLGKPGAGKSTLMKYLSRHEKTRTHLRRWSVDKELVVGSFLFWKPGADPQKSQRGLDTQSLMDDIVILEQQQIEEAFNKIIRQPQTYNRCRFGYFLDGLDEFKDKLHHKTRQQLVALILGWVKESNGHIKVIASSRHYVEFESVFKRSPGIRLQDLTESDMAAVVTGRLAEIQGLTSIASVDCSTLSMIKSNLLEKAQGVFLWVTLVSRSVEAGILQGDSWRALEQKIDTLPVELENILQCILDDISASDRTKAFLTFAAVEHRSSFVGGFPLWLYSFMGDIVLDPDFVTKQPPSIVTYDQFKVQLIKSKRQVYGMCKGLLEVIGRDISFTIDFTHRSVVEFLKHPKIEKETHKLAGSFGHIHILWQCFLGCVKMIGFPNSYDNEFAYNVSLVIQEYLTSTCQTQQQDPERQGGRRICDFLDHLIECVEGRKRETVSPKGAAIYLTETIAFYLSRLRTDIRQFLSPKRWDGDGNYDVYFSGKVDPAVFLACILHGGYMAIFINFVPDGEEMQYYQMDVITDSFPMNLRIVAEGFPEAFLLTARPGGFDQPLWLQDIVEKIFSGRTLALFREMI
ncbi:hypothetical protein VP1G_09853 [Cytospora mali]|uniref:NACHT domain-containing protein n=1 Tax=Cytospora mali TaxID=578113 RepID=A0A194VFF4_CYTMA|nr:hypothetical protein VP1G_09853 [Valsa mali var. pyri (nom. inval.)]